MLWSAKALVRQSTSQGGCWLKIPLASSDHFHIPSVQTSPSILADKLSLDFVPIWALFAFVESAWTGGTSRSAPALLPKPPRGARSKAKGGIRSLDKFPPPRRSGHFLWIERSAKRMSPVTNCSEEERAARSNRTDCTSQPVGGTLKSKLKCLSSGKAPNII